MLILRRAQIYTLKFGPLAAGGGKDQQKFQVDTEYDFELYKLTAYVFDANGIGVLETQWPHITTVLQDGTTKQALTSDETPIRNVFGVGPLPHTFKEKHVVKGGATFFASLTNNAAAIAFSVYLSFEGILIVKGVNPEPTR